MLSILGRDTRLCDGLSRRELLRVGGLAFAGLSMADVLRLRAASPAPIAKAARAKSVIMIWMRGGPSHIDSYDMKPDAPAEIRGEFAPIATNVKGIHICEHLPLHARMMDKLAIIRGIRSNDLGDHTPHYILTGHPDRGIRPTMGAVVSYLRPRSDGLPPYVSSYEWDPYDSATYTGAANRPFIPRGECIENLRQHKHMTIDRLRGRTDLLKQLDSLRPELDARAFAAQDAFTARALEAIASPKVREAFDLNKESPETHARYGKICESFLLARRVVEAGVPVVTVKVGDWDTHEKNFIDMRDQLPKLDQGFHALITDLYDRGLEKDVAVVLWGEFGRAPHISRGDGRDHWPQAGAAVIAGGGFKVGQVIGETDAHGGEHKGTPYTPSHILASLYKHLGIDPSITIPDYNKRPMHVLDEREVVREL